MSLFIVRIMEGPGKRSREKLRGDYSDWQKAIEGMDKILLAYPSHGQNTEHGYWWARDNEGQQFRFVISGDSPA